MKNRDAYAGAFDSVCWMVFILRGLRAKVVNAYVSWYVRYLLPSPGDLLSSDVDLHVNHVGQIVEPATAFHATLVSQNEPLLFMGELQHGYDPAWDVKFPRSEHRYMFLWRGRTLNVPDRLMTRLRVVGRL